MNKTRLEAVVADALRLAEQMMRDSWSGERSSWVPGYEALMSHLREEIAACVEHAIASEREACAMVLQLAAERLAPDGKRTNQVDRHVGRVLATKADELRERSNV